MQKKYYYENPDRRTFRELTPSELAQVMEVVNNKAAIKKSIDELIKQHSDIQEAIKADPFLSTVFHDEAGYMYDSRNYLSGRVEFL